MCYCTKNVHLDNGDGSKDEDVTAQYSPEHYTCTQRHEYSYLSQSWQDVGDRSSQGFKGDKPRSGPAVSLRDSLEGPITAQDLCLGLCVSGSGSDGLSHPRDRYNLHDMNS